MDQDQELAALKALAEAATQEEWLRDGRTVYALQHAGWKKGEEQFENRFFCGVQHGRGTPESELEANAAFIVAAQPQAILSLISRIEQAEAWIATHQRGELLQAMNSATHPSLAAGLSGLTRYEPVGAAIMEVIPPHEVGLDPDTEFVKLTDVQALLAAPARDVGGLTESQREAVREAVQEALARTNAYVCGRTWSAWQVGTMSEDDFQHACTDGDLLDEITAAACEVLATKAAGG